MPVVDPVDRDAGILSLSFNQDRSCIAIATLHGVRIFSIDMHKTLYTDNIGAVSIAEMLFCTNLLAFVGAGEQPALTPRKLAVLNTNGKKLIKDMSFPSAVLAVKMNRKRLVVILERKAIVYELENLVKLKTLDTPPNPKGVCALSVGDGPCYLALPSSGTTGVVRVYDLLVDGGNVLCEIAAHKSPVTVIVMNEDSTMVATASQKGTLINVHSLPDAQSIFTLRRGSTPATIHSLAFSPMSIEPTFLAASGSHGTVHVFRLTDAGRTSVGAAASAAAGLLSAVTRYPLTNWVDPMRSCVAVSLPNMQVPSICTILPVDVPLVDGEQHPDARHMSNSDQVTLVVATLDGLLYEYSLTGLRGDSAKAIRTGEWRLLGSRHTRV
ncbi:hypothetical protein BSKO_00575 [Bryopsis sp. KO-2023]|nr:hypothetical protein BSKO_00575 [Bryopsis sp. KO-2023]